MWLVVIALRLVHILSSIVWLGGSVVLVGFVVPTAKRNGAEGARFMQSLVSESGLPILLNAVGLLSTVAGLGLFYFTSGQFDRDWMRSPMGMTYSAGMAFGLLAAVNGSVIQSATARKLATLGRAIAAAGGAPDPALLAQAGALRDRLARGGHVGVALLTLAAAAMAIARYI